MTDDTPLALRGRLVERPLHRSCTPRVLRLVVPLVLVFLLLLLLLDLARFLAGASDALIGASGDRNG